MNRALCFIPGILPCASSSLYKPLGLALICFPRVPRSENVYTGKKERGRKKEKRNQSTKRDHFWQSEWTPIWGWWGSAALSPHLGCWGHRGLFFPLRLRKRGSCWLARRCKDICASLAGFLVLFQLVAAGWEHAALSCSRFENALFSAPDYCQVAI